MGYAFCCTEYRCMSFGEYQIPKLSITLHGTKAFQNTFEKNTHVVIHYCLNKNTYKKLVIATFFSSSKKYFVT